MSQAPMISVPLKATNEIDWVAPLKNYIQNTYGDDAERYAEECATLNRLRQDTRGAGKDSTAGRDLLYRYYGQLELLDLRFPVDEQHIKISFTWFDAFTHKATSQYSLAFEKASIIFNISAVLSCHAANQARSEESGLKTAYHSFQASAGMFNYINENFLHAPSSDLSRDTVKSLISIMLAQAQEVFLEKQIADQKKVGLLAKLASQAYSLYSQALEGIQDNVTKGIFEKVWLTFVQIKSALMNSMAQYYQALADDDANSHGVAVARLQVAESAAKEASRLAGSFPSSVPPNSNLNSDAGPILSEISKRHLSTVQEKLKELSKDNDYIYHQTVPAEASLAAVPKLPAAKPIPVNELYAGQDIQRITGPDLFAKIVPFAVTESASLYDEEKAKLVRAETERVDLANGEMAASLDYLKLPGALQILKGGFDQDASPDEDFRTWCVDVADHEDPHTIIDALAQDKAYIKAVLDRSSKQLDMEAHVCEKMRSKYQADWTQQPSARLTSTLTSDIRNYRDALDEAAKSDAQLLTKLQQNSAEIEAMRMAAQHGEIDALFQKTLNRIRGGSGSAGSPGGAEPNLLDADFDDGKPSVMDQINKVEEILKKLGQVKRERNLVLKDLKDKAHNDDISQILILNKKSIANYEQQLFQSELEKFRPLQTRLIQAGHKQQALMKELTSAFNNLLQDKRVKAEQSKYESIQRQRSAAINKYKRAYQEFLDLEAGLQGAKRWYSEMKETVESLEKNVDTFVNNRRSEGAQLLNQIEQERAVNKNSQAELERERMRELMERMNVDSRQGTASPPKQGSGRPIPTPLFPSGGAPTYPQMNFQGQYQLPLSPPPQQTSMPQSFVQPQYQQQQQPMLHQQQQNQQPQHQHQQQQNLQQQQQQQQPQYAVYNPSIHGRMAGPTSPAPTQTTFGINAMRPGPTSPPPTQTSFQLPPNRTFSTYGNPNAPPTPNQQQHFAAGAGFQPPPPPPGPPPLGPQQTYHVGGSDYYGGQGQQQQAGSRPNSTPNMHHHQHQPQHQQQQQQVTDPWAGLNAWK